ncbi:MAG: Holliday junction resolvase RuvX [Mycoplasmataceae bacterium]|nr:Holliday junction resolvase RuvX [Mycoplasmataceae bacterium]
MRILAIDYGTKVTGLAITDFNQIIASPLSNIVTSSIDELINKLKKIIEYYQPELQKILVGYPTLLNGNKNNTTLKVEEFVKKLKERFKEFEIILVNEQFTTYVSQQNMYDVGLNHKSIKKNKDKVSACIILETYLSSKN